MKDSYIYLFYNVLGKYIYMFLRIAGNSLLRVMNDSSVDFDCQWSFSCFLISKINKTLFKKTSVQM